MSALSWRVFREIRDGGVWAVEGGKIGPLRFGDYISLSVIGGRESCHIARRPGFWRRLFHRPWVWRPATLEEETEIRKILWVRTGPILDDFKRGDGDPRNSWWPQPRLEVRK